MMAKLVPANVTVEITGTEAYKALVARTRRLEAYAHALERNGVAAGTITRLKDQHLEDGDLGGPHPTGDAT